MPQFLQELLLYLHDLVQGLDHVNGDANRPSLVGYGASYCLAYPPCGIGGELIASAVFKFFDGFHQAHVSLLNKV